MTNLHKDQKGAGLFAWQARIFTILWASYASYYLCRLNFSVAQPAIQAEFPAWSLAKLGAIPSVYAGVYAAGQFFNGQLASRFGARRMMTAAMLVVATANIMFSQAHSYGAMLACWALNGWAQSAGWSLVVSTMAMWTPRKRRGIVVGLLSTCYQLGNVFAWLLAGYLSVKYGWRAAFWVPGAFMVPMACALAICLRNRPEDAGFAAMQETESQAIATTAAPIVMPAVEPTPGEILRMTLRNRTLWILALAFFCSNAVRYTFMNWSVQYMSSFQGQSISSGAFKAVALPLIGAVGAVSAGWASDALFRGRRAPLSALMLTGLAIVCVIFAQVPTGYATLAMTLLGTSGFLIFGPDMLMSGAATVDFSHPRAAAAATGLTMSAGALGAVLSGAGVGWLLDKAHGSWAVAFYVLAGFSLVPALLMYSLWNASPKPATK